MNFAKVRHRTRTVERRSEKFALPTPLTNPYRFFPKVVWNFLKKNPASNSIPPIPIPGSADKYLVHPQDKAEFISQTFAKDYMDCPSHCLNQNLPPQVCRIDPPCKPHCPELVVTTSAVLLSIRKLDVNKAGGSLLITNRLLKITGTTVIYPLMRLFNLSLSTGNNDQRRCSYCK
ncbi:hypothetical protein RvY_00801-1 [Ramazzottius varieornatus]|uniref:Uncharacterized protein n=1 Tax=Ramazzottius varieornatus TaxID=947166 RepID=A0A1D1UE17_RAMVA|nr:hypothetical protein RvY_00801-1 [Ramazzottius varieornatus]